MPWSSEEEKDMWDNFLFTNESFDAGVEPNAAAAEERNRVEKQANDFDIWHVEDFLVRSTDSDPRDLTGTSFTISGNALDYDCSDLSSQLDILDDMTDSQAVKHLSHSTFTIAPALPPIRYFMHSKDFNDLLTSVG